MNDYSDDEINDMALRDIAEREADRLAALKAAQPAVPEGWKLVPSKLTAEWSGALAERGLRIGSLQSAVSDMLAAAPSPPAPPAADEPWELRAQAQAAVISALISVEKLLCEKLGRKWAPTGFSIETLIDDLAARPQPAPDLERKYNELLLAVARKWPGETRHETALRYIRETESAEAAPSALGAQEGKFGA